MQVAIAISEEEKEVIRGVIEQMEKSKLKKAFKKWKTSEEGFEPILVSNFVRKLDKIERVTRKKNEEKLRDFFMRASLVSR